MTEMPYAYCLHIFWVAVEFHVLLQASRSLIKSEKAFSFSTMKVNLINLKIVQIPHSGSIPIEQWWFEGWNTTMWPS